MSLNARPCADEINFADEALGHKFSDLNYPQAENRQLLRTRTAHALSSG